MLLLICIVSEALLAATAIVVAARVAWRRNLLDFPNERSSHVNAVPRVGGTAFGPVLLIGAAVWAAGSSVVGQLFWLTLSLAGAVYVLGAIDDLIKLSSFRRLVLQALMAAVLVWRLRGGMARDPGLLSWLVQGLLVLWVVGLTNAYNFMDGIDGIAGIQALVAGGFWIWACGFPSMVGILAACTVGVAAGFLAFNWSPARVFMGDAGSTLLGFVFAAAPLVAAAEKTGPSAMWKNLACGALVVWPFVVDTSATFALRLMRRENVFEAHRSHFYQQLALRLGSHRQVALLYGGLALVGAAAAGTLIR